MSEVGSRDTGTKIPVREGLFTMPSSTGELPALIGTKCAACGEVFFRPIRDGGCPNCCELGSMQELALSRIGTIDSYSTVYQPLPGWEGPVPYGVALVRLPENAFFKTSLSECDLTKVHVGTEVELVLERVGTSKDGHEIIGYKFRPVTVPGTVETVPANKM